MLRNTKDMESEGLAGDFFRKWDDILLKVFRKDRDFKKKLTNTSNIAKYLKFNQELFQKVSIYYKINGSKRNPVITFIFPSPAKKTDSLAEEKFIALQSICLPVQKRQYKSILNFESDFYCPVSKHAVSRIILRLGLKKEVYEGDYKILINQFSYIPIVSEFYSTIFCFLHNWEIITLGDLRNISLIFPTDNGLLLGELNINPAYSDEKNYTSNRHDFRSSVKTFIDDEILKGEEQLSVKDKLIKIFTQTAQTLENPFLMPSATIANVDTPQNVISHSIFYFSKFMLIKDDIIYLMAKEHKIKDNKKFFRLNQAFIKLNTLFDKVKKDSNISDNASIDEIYENLLGDSLLKGLEELHTKK